MALLAGTTRTPAVQGDSFTLAFHNPLAAAMFAVEAQQRLLLAPWPDALLRHEQAEPVWVTIVQDSALLAAACRLSHWTGELLSVMQSKAITGHSAAGGARSGGSFGRNFVHAARALHTKVTNGLGAGLGDTAAASSNYHSDRPSICGPAPLLPVVPGRYLVSCSGMLPTMANGRSSNMTAAALAQAAAAAGLGVGVSGVGGAVGGGGPFSEATDDAAAIDGQLLQQWQELMVVGRNGSTSDHTHVPGAGRPGMPGIFGGGVNNGQYGQGHSSGNYALPFMGPNGPGGGLEDGTTTLGMGMGMSSSSIGQRSDVAGHLVQSLFRCGAVLC